MDFKFLRQSQDLKPCPIPGIDYLPLLYFQAQKDFSIDQFIIIASSRGEPAQFMAAIIGYGIPIIIHYIGFKFRLLQNIRYPRQVLIKRPDFWPPDPLIIIMGPGMVNNTWKSGSFRVMGRSMNHHFIHSLCKSPVPNRFHVKRTFLPVLERGKSFHFHYTQTIDMGG